MAADLKTKLTPAPLSPSERVVLYGERFTSAQLLLGRTNDPQVPLLQADVMVSSVQLGRAVLRTAFLALERAGEIRLEPREKKQLFGLSSSDSLFADRDEGKAEWPACSLEARIVALVDTLQPDGDNDVATIITKLIPRAEDGWASAIGQVIEGLRTRGLLVETGVTEAHIFKPWVLSDEAKALSLTHTHAPIEELLSDSEEHHPEVWRRLDDQISKAIEQQTTDKP